MQTQLDMLGRRWTEGALEFVAPHGPRWRLDACGARAAQSAHGLRRGQHGRSLGASMPTWPTCCGSASAPSMAWNPASPAPAGAARRAQLDELNARRRAKANVSHHYDVDGTVYRRFLDEDLHYSCAYFRNSDDSTSAVGGAVSRCTSRSDAARAASLSTVVGEVSNWTHRRPLRCVQIPQRPLHSAGKSRRNLGESHEAQS